MSKLIPSLGILLAWLATAPALATDASRPSDKTPPIKIAVFDFDLEDTGPDASATKAPAGYSTQMLAVSEAARRLLEHSGLYSLVDTHDVDADPAKRKSLRTCEGCEASIAMQLGAEQALVGLVTRVSNTDYYVSLRITDTKSGRVLDQQSAFFTGADDAWASGARMLIRHTVLASQNPP